MGTILEASLPFLEIVIDSISTCFGFNICATDTLLLYLKYTCVIVNQWPKYVNIFNKYIPLGKNKSCQTFSHIFSPVTGFN